VAAGVIAAPGLAAGDAAAKRPVIICAANGLAYLARGYAVLAAGGDTLEAALQVVTGPEDDPADDSVGLGGLPNEDGVVELDACCMHGPTRRAGSVGAVRGIRNVSRLARAVMEHTGHVMLVAEGAQRFGVAMGFPVENLLTEHSRKIWQLWKEYHSDADWWGPGLSSPEWSGAGERHSENRNERLDRLVRLAAEIGIPEGERVAAIGKVLRPPTGTIHCSVLDAKGDMSGVTTTSGLAYKLAGRCGDSPVLGAGCFTDQDVGSAGATGSGEENLRVAGAHSIIENMRHGMSPEEAGLDALKRIVRNYNNDMSRLRFTDMTYYVLRRDGAYAGVSLWRGYSAAHRHRFAVHDGGGPRLQDTVALLDGNSEAYPPLPAGLAERLQQVPK
jgi:N4-(beta-N-acetylglucosaminyl)-L-asparaginase